MVVRGAPPKNERYTLTDQFLRKICPTLTRHLFEPKANVMQSFKAYVCGRRRRILTHLKSVSSERGGMTSIASLGHIDTVLSWKPHFRHHCRKNPLRGQKNLCSTTARSVPVVQVYGVGSLFLISHQSGTLLSLFESCTACYARLEDCRLAHGEGLKEEIAGNGQGQSP